MRGWRLGKSKANDRVDPIIALAMAAIAAVQTGKPQAYEYRGIARGGDPNPNNAQAIAEREDAQSRGSARGWGVGSRRFGRGAW